jgi:Glycosyl hydrolases family 43
VSGPWRYVGEALPALPAWHGRPFSTWAPEVQDVNGVWTLWASTADTRGNFCLFRATARTSSGPYTVDPRRVPCDASLNGDIDPSMVSASGHWWLLYKTNANAVGRPPTFYSQLIGPDGMPRGPRFVLLTGDQAWEMGMIEAQNLIQDRATGQWWVTFSAGRTEGTDPSYQMYAAPCNGPAGPCYIQGAVRLIGRNAQGAAPGEGYTFDTPDGQAWIAYNPGGYFTAPINRPLALVKLDFDDEGEPYVVTP